MIVYINKLQENIDFLLSHGECSQVVSIVERELPKYLGNHIITHFLDRSLCKAVIMLSLAKIDVVEGIHKSGNFELARMIYKEILEFVRSYLPFFNLENDKIDLFIDELDSLVVTAESIKELIEIKEDYMLMVQNKFNGTLEAEILKIVFDLYYRQYACKIHATPLGAIDDNNANAVNEANKDSQNENHATRDSIISKFSIISSIGMAYLLVMVCVGCSMA